MSALLHIDTLRVGVIAISHESNTFNPALTTIEDFERSFLIFGRVPEKGIDHHELMGFFESLEEEKLEAVPLLIAIADPKGRVSKDAFDHLLTLTFQQIKRAGKLDGLLLAPHGAGVSEEYPDMDGHWISLLREQFPRPFPIISTCDPHGNISRQMIDALDALIAYRTNPHLDQKQCGMAAAKLMARTLRGEARPVLAAAFPPIAINIACQYSFGEPCAAIYAMANDLLRRPKVLSNSVILGFPYADVNTMGSGFVVVTDGDPKLAQDAADEMAGWLLQNRRNYCGEMISADEAVRVALALKEPVCLLDMGDNIGGGSAADGTVLAHELHRQTRGLNIRSFLCINDPAAEREARAHGPGARLRLSIGGKKDNRHGKPFVAEVAVLKLFDGKFHEPEVRHGGVTQFDMGSTAIVETDSHVTIMLTTHPTCADSLQQLVAPGLEPESFHIIVAKGVNGPRAAYGSVCRSFLAVNTPGATCADMRQLAYQYRRKPLFPFEDILDSSESGISSPADLQAAVTH